MTGTNCSELQCCWCVFKFKFQHSNSSTGSPLKFMQHKRTATNPGYQRNRGKFWLITMFLFVAYSLENLIVISALKEVSCNALRLQFSVLGLCLRRRHIEMWVHTCINTFLQYTDVCMCMHTHTHTHT